MSILGEFKNIRDCINHVIQEKHISARAVSGIAKIVFVAASYTRM